MKYIETNHKKWKYKLTETYKYKDSRLNGLKCSHDYFEISRGILTVKIGYAWDGVTGFPDRKEWLRAALVHDVLLQAIYDLKLIDQTFVPTTHKIYRDIIKQDSNNFWAKVMYAGLKYLHGLWHKVTS